ncbi:RNAse III [Magnetococcus marinus MC-1]|uniref:Ribonuclease 3 n=1 Tax=Magnetococcus marinus (strain ATCC BAA-1437 / JCM 17883 / MC-1) TaxID=156889 RepID=RNC_MAGMM|nr:ribonuclease III [Magnetococcus marinus]A0L633.1 RecName: Full=Ribonuclease 3; AltName: Full=Ribonuclease III; Short=RNase III [Magnetococcus marinus MC-1]ABK43426.1 RNAse III [Magnetococcus marinus MC-1]
MNAQREPSGLERLEQALDYRFTQSDLLQLALTHRSAPLDGSKAGEVVATTHNERLEFLGDSVLNLIVSHRLYKRFGEVPEGQLSQWRAMLVNTRSLSEVAKDLELGRYLRMGRGEAKSGGREKYSILGNALEALLGAIYLDGGFEAAERVVDRLFAHQVAGIEPEQQGKDYKTLLQEYLQARGEALPIYAVLSAEGPPHERVFVVSCHPREQLCGHGQGRSKREAEQHAAQQALELLIESENEHHD